MSKKIETAKTLPAYRMFCVTKGAADKSVWQEIGAAWKHKDGKGFNIQFNALPLPEGEIVLREPKPRIAAKA
ncbi:MAG TPA: hypothetical protein VGG48_00930 [Rhizomicrobium sp.]|jgi:hypothetical protein